MMRPLRKRHAALLILAGLAFGTAFALLSRVSHAPSPATKVVATDTARQRAVQDSLRELSRRVRASFDSLTAWLLQQRRRKPLVRPLADGRRLTSG